MDDLELLRDYVASGAEQAFEVIVKRHVNLVYSAALRQVHDPVMAGEVTQTVFIILARKARKLGSETILSGWLYRTAQFAGAKALRTEYRRRTREQKAAQMEPEKADSAWDQIAPFLEQAMAHLGEADRNAVVLRYFENQSLKAVGTALGINEDTAQKRVARAVEKLRTFFAKRNVVLSAAILAATLSAHAVHSAPAGIAASALTAAAPGGAAWTASASLTTLIKGTLTLMAWTKAKTGIVVALSILLLACISLVTLLSLGRLLHNNGPVIIDEASSESSKFPSRFWAAVISPDGKTLATTGGGYNMPREAGEIVLWDLAAGREKLIRRQLSTIRSMAFSHDGKRVAFGDFSGTTKIMESVSGNILGVLSNHVGIVNSVLFTPNDEAILSTCFDGTITLWNYKTGKEEVAFQMPGERPLSVALSPDNSTLIAVTWEGNGYAWKLASREQMYTFRGANKKAMVEGLAFAPDGKTFMTGSRDSLFRIWNTATGEPVRDLVGENTIVTEAVFTPDGKTLFTGGFKGDLVIWNPATGEHIRTISAHAERFYGLVLTADGKQLITAGWDYTIKNWDVQTLEPVATLMRAVPEMQTSAR